MRSTNHGRRPRAAFDGGAVAARVGAALLLLGVGLPLAWAGDQVTVDDTDVTFPVRRTETFAGKQVELRCTGAGLREKAWFNVYAIASYVAADQKPKGATDLAALDAPKMLLLVMERDVSGADMVSALGDAIRANHPSGLNDELKRLSGYFSGKEAQEGKRITFLHLPGKGVSCQLEGQAVLTVESLPFARAIWDIYLGKAPVTDDLKEALTKRL